MSEETRAEERTTVYRGAVDTATTQIISGWVVHRGKPEDRLDLDVYLGDCKVGSVRADRHRPDLERLGVGDGRYGFLFRFPEELSSDAVATINVRTLDGARLVPHQSTRFRAHIDRFTDTELKGWALNTLMAGQSLTLDVLINGAKVCEVVADRARPDLIERFGSGNHGFIATLPFGAGAGPESHVQLRDHGSGATVAEIGHARTQANEQPLAVGDPSSSSSVASSEANLPERPGGPETMGRWIAAPTVGQPATSPKRPAVFGIAAILLFFGGFGTWAATSPLDRAVLAHGVVAVEGHRREVQHLEGGIVRAVLVENGQRVSDGDVLVRLDQTLAKAGTEALTSQLVALLARQARLEAERDGRNTIEFPSEVFAVSDNEVILGTLQEEREVFRTRLRAFEGQRQLLQQRVDELHERIRGLNSQKRAQERQLQLVQDELEGLRRLFEKGYVTRPRILGLEREQARLQGQGGELVSNIAETRDLINQVESQITQLSKERFEQIADEIRDVSDRLANVRPELRKFRDSLERTEIRAPASGYVLGMTTLAPGSVIRAGEPIFQIVPSTARLVVQAQVPPNEVENLHPGLPAQVRLTGYPVRTTPTIEGKLTYVSADILTNERTGEPYFEVKVDVLGEEAELPRGIELSPGMPAEAAILTQARTALDYLISPLLRSAERAGREE